MMPSDLYGEAPAEGDEGIPEPPAPDGPGLFGMEPAAASPAAPVAAAPAATPYRVLARKYRPQTLDDLIGQEALVRVLRNAFGRGRVHHAFLLTGVRGVGKTTTARIIARALNCVGPDGKGGPTADPCGACPECVAILADRHPDVVEMDAASNRGIDDVRELREALRFRPAQGRQKVFILDEVHMLTEQAFNALLKSLEEPPPAITFILATTELRKVPITIRSRCQTFALKRVPEERLRAHFARIGKLEGATLEDGALAMLARAADGSVRDGLSLLDQAIALGSDGAVSAQAVQDMLGLADRALVLDILEAVLKADLPTALRRMTEAHEAGAEPATVMGDLLEQVHMLTRFSAIPALRDDPALPEAERVRGGALAGLLSVPMLTRAWQMLLKGIEEVNAAPDRRAAAEMVLIRLAHVAEMPTPGELVKRLQAGGTATASGAGGAPAPSGGPALRAVAGGAGVAVAAPVPAPLAQPTAWREVVALAHGLSPLLHAHLLHDVHPVRVEPPLLEIRARPQAPRDLGAKLAALLEERTGRRWTIALTNAPGEPTLAEQAATAEAGRREMARSHPMVVAILDAFPGATLDEVRDEAVDHYGLKAEPMPEPDMPDFAPPEAEPAGYSPDEPAGYDPDETPQED
jgi:DNA polymerase-3 subunit gamma/tau